MNLENVRSKKSLKLITLLLASLLIASASAMTYYGMYINGTITVRTADIIWVKGTNQNATISITGSTVTVGLSAMNGTPQNFTNCLYLKNLAAAKAYSMNFSTTTALSATYFNTAKVLIYNNATGAFVNSLDITTTSSPSVGNSLAGGGVYSLVFEISSAVGASGPYSFSVKVTYQ
jgi:hypothetical protein